MPFINIKKSCHLLILRNHLLILRNHLLILENHLLILSIILLILSIILTNALFVHFGLPYYHVSHPLMNLNDFFHFIVFPYMYVYTFCFV